MSPLEDSLELSYKEQLALSECLALSRTSRPVCPVLQPPPPTLPPPTPPHLSRFRHNLLQGAFPETPGRSAHPTLSEAVPGPAPSELLSCWVTSAVSLSGFLCPPRTRSRLDSSLSFQHRGLSWIVLLIEQRSEELDK